MKLLIYLLLNSMIVVWSAQSDDLEHARQLFNEKRYREAELIIEKYLRDRASDVEALLLAGDIAVQQEQLNRARQCYQRAYEQDRDNSIAVRSYTRILSDMGEHTTSIAILRRAVRSKPNDVYLRLALGNALLAADSLRAAELEITKAREMSRSIPDGYLALGDLYFSQRVYLLAKDNYEQALKLDPDNLAAHEKLALVYFRLANAETVDNTIANEYYTRSLQEWATILKRDSLYARAYFEQGKILFYASKLPEAAYSLSKYIQIRPDAHNALLARWYLAQSLERIGKCDEVEEHLGFVINNIDSVRHKATLMLARCYFDLHRYSESAALYRQIEREQPESLSFPLDQERYGYSLILSGDTTAGITILRNVADMDSSRCASIFRLAEYYRTHQLYADAIVMYRRHLSNCHDTLAARVYALLGATHFSANQPADAIEALKRSIAIDSTIIFAYRMWAASEKSIGSKAESIIKILRMGLNFANTTSDRALLYSMYCQILLEERRFDALLDIAKAWQKTDPDRAEAALYAAVAYQGTGDKDNACKYYREALRLNPSLEVARRNLKQLDCTSQ